MSHDNSNLDGSSQSNPPIYPVQRQSNGKAKSVSISMTPELEKELTELAKKLGINKSKMFQRILEDYKALEIFTEKGGQILLKSSVAEASTYIFQLYSSLNG